jgi:hypothetical protein
MELKVSRREEASKTALVDEERIQDLWSSPAAIG